MGAFSYVRFFIIIQMMIGAPKSALTVEIGNGLVAKEHNISHASNKHAPIRAESGIV